MDRARHGWNSGLVKHCIDGSVAFFHRLAQGIVIENIYLMEVDGSANLIEITRMPGEEIIHHGHTLRPAGEKASHQGRSDESSPASYEESAQLDRHLLFPPQVPNRIFCNSKGIRFEIEHLQRYPPLIVKFVKRTEQRDEIVIARTRNAAIAFVDVNVTNDVPVCCDQFIVRFGLVGRVVNVEHGSNGRAADLADDFRCFGKRAYYVRRYARASFGEQRHAARFGVRREVRQAIYKVTRGLGCRHAAGRRTLFRGAEDHDSARTEIGAQVNQVAHVLPASFAKFPVRCRYVKRSWPYQNEVQPNNEMPSEAMISRSSRRRAESTSSGCAASVNGAISMPS